MSMQQRRMAPQRWEPMRDIETMAERMRRLLEESFGGGGGIQMLPDGGVWSPAVDVEETEDAFVVEAELPGVEREDVDIELVGDELLIRGEIKERERQGIIRRRTRRTGRFEYRIVLPDHVAGDQVQARLDNGILTVRVPKSERAQRRRIEVTS